MPYEEDDSGRIVRAEFENEPVGAYDFKGRTFLCRASFTDGVDFTGATFKNGASFKGTKFLAKGKAVSFKEALFESSGNDVTFEGARLGKPYRREFGEWVITFYREEESYSISLRKKGREKAEKRAEFSEETMGEILAYTLEDIGLDAFKREIENAFKRPAL